MVIISWNGGLLPDKTHIGYFNVVVGVVVGVGVGVGVVVVVAVAVADRFWPGLFAYSTSSFGWMSLEPDN